LQKHTSHEAKLRLSQAKRCQVPPKFGSINYMQLRKFASIFQESNEDFDIEA